MSTELFRQFFISLLSALDPLGVYDDATRLEMGLEPIPVRQARRLVDDLSDGSDRL